MPRSQKDHHTNAGVGITEGNQDARGPSISQIRWLSHTHIHESSPGYEKIPPSLSMFSPTYIEHPLKHSEFQKGAQPSC